MLADGQRRCICSIVTLDVDCEGKRETLIGDKGIDGSTDDDKADNDTVGNKSSLIATLALFEMQSTISTGARSILVVGLTDLLFSLWYSFHLLKRTAILVIG